MKYFSEKALDKIIREKSGQVYTAGEGLALSDDSVFSIHPDYLTKIEHGESAFNYFEVDTTSVSGKTFLKLNTSFDGFYSEGSVSAGGLSQGGGSTGGNASYVKIDANGGTISNGTDEVSVYSRSYIELALANAGAVKTVAGQHPNASGDVTANSLKTALDLKALSHLDTITVSYITDIADNYQAKFAFDIVGTDDEEYDLDTISLNASHGNTAYGYFTDGILGSAHLPSMYIAQTQVSFSKANDNLLGVNMISYSGSSTGDSDSSRIVWEPNAGGTGVGAWHFLGNVYASGFISAGGLSTGEGSFDFSRIVRNDGTENAIQTIAVVTSYPTTSDPNTLYILVSS